MQRSATLSESDALTPAQERALAAMLRGKSVTDAAACAGVDRTTLHRWLRRLDFLSAYRRARRELVEGAVGRIQAGAGQAVDTLLEVAVSGAKDSDRVRAAIALLDRGFRGLAEADVLSGSGELGDESPIGTDGVVKLLSNRLRQIDEADLPTREKARLTVPLADALLRAISVDVLDKRFEALQAVLGGRKVGEKR